MIVLVGLFVMGCATYYDKTSSAERALLSGDYKNAQSVIEKNKYLSKRRNSLLYYLEMGRLSNLRGEFEQSNVYLNKADDMMGMYRNIFEMTVGATVNQSIQPYKTSPNEEILVHYYKALNYMQLGNVEEALVEARRLDLTAAQNDADVNSKEKKYGKDPLGMIMMGMLYEMDNDYNNAFIAYRNAKEIYLNDETGLFKGNIPGFLEQDISRTGAYARMTVDNPVPYPDVTNGEAIIFWENGLAPIKDENNLFFSLVKINGVYFFQSGDIIIPVDYNFEQDNPNFKASDIGLVRVASAFLIPRPIPNIQLKMQANGQTERMALVADITAIALQYEKDNYLKELGKNLLRLTLKKISELALSKENEYAGAALGIVNVATEKADTRNWQTLPGQIHYTRIPLKEGENKITLEFSNGQSYEFTFNGNGQTYFKNVVTF